MSIDYTFLKEKIKRSGYTQEEFAGLLNIAQVTLSEKLNNKSEFKQNEMFRIQKILKLSNRDLIKFFFTEKLKKS